MSHPVHDVAAEPRVRAAAELGALAFALAALFATAALSDAALYLDAA